MPRRMSANTSGWEDFHHLTHPHVNRPKNEQTRESVRNQNLRRLGQPPVTTAARHNLKLEAMKKIQAEHYTELKQYIDTYRGDPV